MRSTIRVAPALLAGAAAILCPTTAVAQDSEPTGPETDAADDENKDSIVVTGTRIRGAESASDTVTLSRETIAAAGQVDLGEAVRSLPQNFNGGQNPGVGTGAGLINSNVNSASTVNLRGLGPDATLTLLNGHRLPSNGAFAGIDISAIPLAALDRIEIVADSASALYGSDAVAGVVNVILRRDFDGVITSGQLGASTDGGYFRQQADIVGGKRWSGGGFVLAYDYAHNSAITARQRSYAASLDPLTSLFPELRRHAATLSAHQDLGGGIAASVDVLYANRHSETVGGTAASRQISRPRNENFTIAPALEASLGSAWTARAVGTYGIDRTRYPTTITSGTGAQTLVAGCLCNRATSLEAGAEGPLFALAGGDARVALGAGYRNNRFAFSRIIDGTPATAFDVERDNTFAYGEVFLPFVSPENDLTGVNRLSLSAALRYEDYPGVARLATPRLGLVYSPVRDLTLRGTWSRAFKAPTLFQQYTPYEAFLFPAAAFGAGGAGSTVFYTSGGNPDLGPERARSWTAGFELRPAANLTLEATWFDIRYTDRVLQPIAGSIAAAFNDPGYASLIDRTPDVNELTELAAGAQFGLRNFSGAPYDPARVVALLDNRNINVAAQAIRGVDARIAWRGNLRSGSTLSLDVAGTWLDSQQQLTSALPEIQLAGTVFNPPKLRMRGSAAWQSGALQASTAINYTGALADRRFATPTRVAPSATLDLGLRYTLIPGRGKDPGLAVSLIANNVLDDKPEVIRTTGPTDTPYDSTNYSPIGRFVAIGLTRSW